MDSSQRGCDLLVFDVKSFYENLEWKEALYCATASYPSQNSRSFFALVFGILYSEVYRLIPRLIYKFYLINTMHRPKTLVISSNSPALLYGTL